MNQIARGGNDPTPPEGGTTRMPQTSQPQGQIPPSIICDITRYLAISCDFARGSVPVAGSTDAIFCCMVHFHRARFSAHTVSGRLSKDAELMEVTHVHTHLSRRARLYTGPYFVPHSGRAGAGNGDSMRLAAESGRPGTASTHERYLF